MALLIASSDNFPQDAAETVSATAAASVDGSIQYEMGVVEVSYTHGNSN